MYQWFVALRVCLMDCVGLRRYIWALAHLLRGKHVPLIRIYPNLFESSSAFKMLTKSVETL